MNNLCLTFFSGFAGVVVTGTIIIIQNIVNHRRELKKIIYSRKMPILETAIAYTSAICQQLKHIINIVSQPESSVKRRNFQYAWQELYLLNTKAFSDLYPINSYYDTLNKHLDLKQELEKAEIEKNKILYENAALDEDVGTMQYLEEHPEIEVKYNKEKLVIYEKYFNAYLHYADAILKDLKDILQQESLSMNRHCLSHKRTHQSNNN